MERKRSARGKGSAAAFTICGYRISEKCCITPARRRDFRGFPPKIISGTRPFESASCSSVPNPKFATLCGVLVRELRIPETYDSSVVLVWIWRVRSKNEENF
jgi:hypothetical protein